MSDALIEVFLSLRIMLMDLLALARDEAWDDFVEHLPEYQAQVSTLPEIDWREVLPAEKESFRALLSEIQQLQDELINQSQSKRDELAANLQGFHNANRLDKAYRM